MTELQGMIAWVTGASSGIGRGVAGVLARRGARLALSARRTEVLEEVRSSLERPLDHRTVPLDLSAPESFAAALDEVEARLGPVELLVHGAGVSQRSLAAETDLGVDRRLIEVDYLGPVALTKTVLPGMLERDRGRIVVVTSVVGKIPSPFRTGYAAAKHALHGFFESLRAELAGTGVKITVVVPGFVRTNVSRNALTGDGSPLEEMDPLTARGMAPERCAERIVAAVERGAADVVIAGPRERLGMAVHRFAPWLFRRMIARVKVR